MKKPILDKILIGIAAGAFGLGIGNILGKYEGRQEGIREGNGGFIEGYSKGVYDTTPDSVRLDTINGVEYISGINRRHVEGEDISLVCEKWDPKTSEGITYVCNSVENPSN